MEVNVICPPCNEQKHTECTNPDTCPCQHRKTVHMADGTVSPQSERGALRMVEEEKPIQVSETKRKHHFVVLDANANKAKMGRIK